MRKKVTIVFTTVFIYMAVFGSSLFFFRTGEAVLVDQMQSDNTRVGTIDIYYSDTAPSGYLICNGQAVSRTTYANLFSVIGTTYGSGDGSTTFNVPDLRGVVAAGKGSGDFSTLNKSGGSATKSISSGNLPSHRHHYSATANKVSLTGKMYDIARQDTSYPGSASGVWSMNGSANAGDYRYGGTSKSNYNEGFSIDATHNHSFSITANGSGDSTVSITNMMPYKVGGNYIIRY